jgi:hypothetical protein
MEFGVLKLIEMLCCRSPHMSEVSRTLVAKRCRGGVYQYCCVDIE